LSYVPWRSGSAGEREAETIMRPRHPRANL